MKAEKATGRIGRRSGSGARALFLAGAMCGVCGVQSMCAAGCSDEEDNRLYGSMSEVYDLGFDRVQLVRQGDSLLIEYLRDSGASRGKTVKLVVNLAGIVKVAGTSIDLTEIAGGGPRGTLQRVQAITTDYRIQRGTLELDQTPDVGADVTGRFHTTLVEPVGRTLNGDFSAKVTAP